MIKSIPDGVYPTMVTPFTAENTIDYNAVEQLIEWYCRRGVSGIFAICQSSEIFFLSFEEKLALLKFILKHVPKGTVVIASGHTADDIDRQIYEANAFIQTGIDGYVFISNRFASPEDDDSRLIENMQRVVDAIDEVALGVYECPYPYKRLMTPEVLRQIAPGGRFRFLKDTCCDADMIAEKIKAVEGTGLKIFNANAAILLETLRMGCAGYSGVMANFHPELYAWLCENYLTQPEKAEHVQDFVGFFSVAECQQYPVNAKYYLGLEGIDMGYASRARNSAEFTRNRQVEIDQMRALTLRFKEQMGI